MTNYNERLDEVLANLCCSLHVLEVSDCPTCHPKQALTSLNKELVAEAKPGKYSSGESILNVDGIGEVDGYEGYNQAIDQFEQNLLKALGEI